MVNHLQGIQHHKRFNGSNCKTSHTNFGIIIYICLFHVSVLSVIIPKNFVLMILDFILFPQPSLMGICELFLVKNCMRLVFSKFSDNKVALIQLLIFVSTPLMSFKKLVGFGLVMFRLVSSANKANVDLFLLSLVIVIFIISLI